jgi:hypothetical protein
MAEGAGMTKRIEAVRCACALVFTVSTVSVAGCVSSSVTKGTLIGAGSGLVLGAGTGALISNDKLLGSRDDRLHGNTSLEPGSTIAVSALVGTVFGAVIGAMVGKANESEDETNVEPTFMPAPAPAKAALGPSAF